MTLKIAIISLAAAIVLAVLGFGGFGGDFIAAARILTFVAIASFLFFLVFHIAGGGRGGGMGGPRDPH